MLKVFAFLTKREDIETQAFIEHYEGSHVPLICSLAPAPIVYRLELPRAGRRDQPRGRRDRFRRRDRAGLCRQVRLSLVEGDPWLGQRR